MTDTTPIETNNALEGKDMYNIQNGIAKFETVSCSVDPKVGEFMELPLCANGWHVGRFEVVQAEKFDKRGLAMVRYVAKQVA